MHGALFSSTPVLSLAPDSIASLGDLDATSLSDLWGVFTKCKDSLQDGRRLENLSWRLWFDSGRKEAKMHDADRTARDALGVKDSSNSVLGLIGPGVEYQAGWSDPEWTEATDSESDGDAEDARAGRTQSRRASSSKAPAAADAVRPNVLNRGSSGGPFDRRSTSTITGGSLQRMITGLTTLPAITAPNKGNKARSCVDVPLPHESNPLPSPRLATRGASAPDVNIPPLASPLLPIPNPVLALPASPPHVPIPKADSHQPSTLLRSPQLDRKLSANGRSNSSRSMAAARSNASTPTPKKVHKAPATVLAPVPAAALAPRLHPVQPPRASGSSLAFRNDSHSHLPRNASTASFEPKSIQKGFDTTAFDSRPQVGSIAPPPTPAQAPSAELGSPPPPASAMKSATARPSTGKKIFFISSPTSDSDEEGSPTRPHHHHHKISPPKAPTTQVHPPASPRPSPQGRPPPADEDEWDDEDEEGSDDSEDDDDDDASSGWGSEYSTESEEPSGRPRPERPPALFAKRPSMVPAQSELKPRPPGLLSQLFHPGLMDEDDRRHSHVDVTRAPKALPSLHTSRSAGVLTEKLRSKSFLRGAPAGTEMESSSEEEDGNGEGEEDEDDDDDYEDESTSSSEPTGNAAAALARRQRLEAAGPIAPPQTPRTTRRAMLATELSESLRRNLLWERQTRNRVLGAPVDPRFRPTQPPSQNPNPPPPAAARTASANVPGGAAAAAAGLLLQEGLRAPHPSPVTRDSSPVPPMVRRHTTGTGLYLAAQTGALAQGRTVSSSHSSESSLDEEDEPTPAGADVYGSAFTHGLHHHGW
ncbi:hypothetical protein RQP46_010960 [Phenoliferia psychrophenolica]